jgi:hypothetical protein
MSLASGKYLTKVERTVVVWPAADARGNGAPQWITQRDREGREIGRVLEKDANGNEIKAYLPPEGFANRPGYDHTDNYVMVDSRGEVQRQANGQAICIKPGQALVFNADGTVEVLDDEYNQYVFGLAHDSVSEETPAEVSDTEPEDSRDARIKELEAKLAEVGAS